MNGNEADEDLAGIADDPDTRGVLEEAYAQQDEAGRIEQNTQIDGAQSELDDLLQQVSAAVDTASAMLRQHGPTWNKFVFVEQIVVELAAVDAQLRSEAAEPQNAPPADETDDAVPWPKKQAKPQRKSR